MVSRVFKKKNLIGNSDTSIDPCLLRVNLSVTLLDNNLSSFLRDALAPFLKNEEERQTSENNAINMSPFQYILCAATSPAVKHQDETLTYLNQGSYLLYYFSVISTGSVDLLVRKCE